MCRRVPGRRQNESGGVCAAFVSEPPETIDRLVPEETSDGGNGVDEAARPRLLSDIV